MFLINWTNNPILAQRRKGTIDDPFVSIQENLTVIQEKTVLTEVPNKMEKVDIYFVDEYSSDKQYVVGDLIFQIIEGEKVNFECIQDSLGISTSETDYWKRIYFIEVSNVNKVLDRFEYYVDYLNGIVSHNEYFNNKTLTYQYLGEGTHLFPASRIYSGTVGIEVINTLENIIQTSATKISIHDRQPLPEEGEEGEIWLVI